MTQGGTQQTVPPPHDHHPSTRPAKIPDRRRPPLILFWSLSMLIPVLATPGSVAALPPGALALLVTGWALGAWFLGRATASADHQDLDGRFQTLLERTEDWEIWQSLDGRMRYVSSACERLTGHPPSAFIGEPELLASLVHPADRAAFLAHERAFHSLEAPDPGPQQGQLDFRILDSAGEIRWIGHRCRRYAGPQEPLPGCRSSNRDITEAKGIEVRLTRTTALLESINEAQSLFLGDLEPREVFGRLLDTLVTMTESGYGFLDEVLQDERGTYKLSLALSDISWSAESKALYDQLAARNLEFRNLDNLAGTPALTGQLLIANNPAHHPGSGGTPPGHPELRNFMGMPVYFGRELVGVAGVANREGGYDPALAAEMAPFLGSCAAIIHAFRLESQRAEAEAALLRANRHNRALLEADPDPLVVIDADGRISDLNVATERATGHARDALIGTDFSAYFSDPEQARRGYRLAFEHGQIRDYALEMLHSDGRRMPVLYNASVYRDVEGCVEQVIASARDITDLKRLTATLEARLRLLRQAETLSVEEILQASVDEAVYLTDSLIGFMHFLDSDQQTLRLQTWSTRTLQEYCRAEGPGLHYPVADAGIWCDCVRERRAVIHNDYATVPHRRGLPPGHADIVRQLVVPVLRGDLIVAILGVGNKASNYGHADLQTVSVFADLAWDIAERKRAEERLDRMAHYDALTGLPNRVLLADRLQVAMAQSRRDQMLLALCYLDLDGFKPINDTYGHEAGDRLLVKIAKSMQENLRAEDTVARIGGDEFVLVLGRIKDLDHCQATLSRLLTAIAAPVDIAPGIEARVSASIGVTLHPLDQADADTLIRHADRAMYSAKSAGRNCAFLYAAAPGDTGPVRLAEAAGA